MNTWRLARNLKVGMYLAHSSGHHEIKIVDRMSNHGFVTLTYKDKNGVLYSADYSADWKVYIKKPIKKSSKKKGRGHGNVENG